jgi:hypothetical protein
MLMDLGVDSENVGEAPISALLLFNGHNGNGQWQRATASLRDVLFTL